MIDLLDTGAVETLRLLPARSVALIATDPLWNTGGVRKAAAGSYDDKVDHDEYLSYMGAFLREAARVLAADGTLAIWTDYRYSPHLAVLGETCFGSRECRVGEIVVESLLGNPGKSRWPVKHSTITLFCPEPAKQKFHVEGLPDVDRRAGGQKRVSTANATYDYGAQKKVASVLQGTMSNTDPQRLGYPDQKPDWIYEALIRCFTDEGQLVVDPFAGSGTCGAACLATNRHCLLSDTSPIARALIRARLNLPEDSQ